MAWHLRTSFNQVLSLEKFYTGGPVLPTKDGARLVCFYDNRLSLLTVPHGRYDASISVSDEGDMLTAMVIHPTRDEAVVTSKSGVIYVVDLEKGLVLRTRKSSHQAVITCIVFDATGSLFATTSADKSVRVCNYDGLYDTHCFRDFSTLCVKSMFLYDMESPNQYLYLITLSRSELLVHELHSKQCIGKITAHLSTIFAFTLLDDYLISSGEDKVLVITQIAAGSLIQKRIVNIHSTFVDMVVCGDALVGPSTSDGDMLRFVLSEVFNTKTTENYVNHYASTGMDLNYSKDLMSTNHHYCSKYLGRPFAEDFVSDPPGNRKHNSYVGICSFFYKIPYSVGSSRPSDTAVHHFLLSTTSDLLILLFDATTMEYICPPGKQLPDPLSISEYSQLPRFRMLVVSTICSDSGEVLDIKKVSNNELAIGTSSNQIRVIRYLESSEESGAVTVVQNYSCYGHSDYVTCIGASAESSAFCTASKDGTVRLWQRLPLEVDISTTDLYASMQVSHSAGNEQNVLAYPLQLAITPWVCTAILEDAASDIDCVVLCAGKRWFAATGAADKCLRIYDLSAFAQLSDESVLTPRTLHPTATVLAHLDSINHIALSPNQRQLATVSADLSLKLWGVDDLSHPQFIVEMQKAAKRTIWSVEYSLHEKLLALACGDKRIRLVQITGRGNSGDTKLSLFKTLEGHGNAVMRACFMSHGQQLVSVGADGLIKVWNLETADCVLSLQNARKIRDLGLEVDHLYGTESLRKMWGLIVLDDGRACITGDSDGIIRWYVDNTEEVRQKEKEAESLCILQKEEVESVLVGSSLDRDAVVKAFRLALNIYTSKNRIDTVPHTARSVRDADIYLQKIIAKVCDSEDQMRFLAEAIEATGLIRVPELLHLAQIWMRNGRLSRLGSILLLATFRAYPVGAIVSAYGDRIASTVEELARLMSNYLRKIQLLHADCALIDMSYSYFSFTQ